MPSLQELLKPAANEDLSRIYVPFTAFLRITPIRGKRSESIRDMQKIAADVETEIDDLCGVTDAVAFDFAKPVAYTPAFGDTPARLTIHGHACARTTFTKTPVGLQNVVSDGRKQTGYGAGNAINRIPDSTLNTTAKEIKDSLENATGLTVYRLEVAGYIYGISGTSFPL